MSNVIEYVPGMIVGNGFDSTSGDIKITPAVKGNIGRVQGNSGGQSGDFSFRMTTSIEEFELALNIEAEAKYGYPRLRKGGKGKFNFKKKLKIAEETVCLIMSLNVQNAVESFNQGAVLTKDAEELLQLKKTKRFRERFGNHFISGIHTGGEFHAVFQIEKKDFSKSIDLATKIQGSYGPFSAKAGVSRKVKQEISNESVYMHVFQKGGFVGPVLSIDELFAKCKTVAKDIKHNNSVPYAVLIEEYNELKLPGDDISWVQAQAAERTIKHLGQLYKNFEKLLNKIEYILFRHPEYYARVNEKQLSSYHKKISQILNQITDAADLCIRDFDKCERIDFSLPDIKWPGKRKTNRKGRRRGGLARPKPKPKGVRANPKPITMSLHQAAIKKITKTKKQK